MVDDPDPDSVAALMRTVGGDPRRRAEDYERVLGASRVAWQRAVRQRARRRWTYALAAGMALVVLGAGVLRQLDDSQLPPCLRAPSRSRAAPYSPASAAGDDWRWLPASGVPLIDRNAAAHRCLRPRGVAAGSRTLRCASRARPN